MFVLQKNFFSFTWLKLVEKLIHKIQIKSQPKIHAWFNTLNFIKMISFKNRNNLFFCSDIFIKYDLKKKFDNYKH